MNSQSSGMFGVGKIPDDWMGEQNDDNENTFGQFPENLDGWFSQDEFLDQAPSFPVATSVTSLISSVENSSDDSKSMDKQSTGSVLPQQSPSQYLHEMHLRHLEQINHSTKSTHYFDRPLDGPRSFLPIDGLADSDGEPEMSRFKGGDDYGSDDSDYSDENGANEELSAPTKLSSTDRKSRKSKRSDGKTIEVLDLNAKAKNREHAKNTRQRKKHYIEALKETVKILSDERERIDRERRIALSRLAEQTNVRKQVLQTFLFYRSTGEMDIQRWRTILDESFVLVLPITPYRSFPPSEIDDTQRKLIGVEAVIADTASLSVMLQTIGKPLNDDGEKIQVQYYCNTNDSSMNGDNFMCKWMLKTENAVARGARFEVYKQGLLKATFTPQNRLSFVEFAYDVMNVMQQLRRTTGDHDFQVIPNTLPLAYEPSPDPRVITESMAPFKITFANESFCRSYGYTSAEVVGCTCSIFQGKLTELERMAELIRNAKLRRPGLAMISNYTSSGQKIMTSTRVYPLYKSPDSQDISFEVTHFLWVLYAVSPRPLAIQTEAVVTLTSKRGLSRRSDGTTVETDSNTSYSRTSASSRSSGATLLMNHTHTGGNNNYAPHSMTGSNSNNIMASVTSNQNTTQESNNATPVAFTIPRNHHLEAIRQEPQISQGQSQQQGGGGSRKKQSSCNSSSSSNGSSSPSSSFKLHPNLPQQGMSSLSSRSSFYNMDVSSGDNANNVPVSVGGGSSVGNSSSNGMSSLSSITIPKLIPNTMQQANNNYNKFYHQYNNPGGGGGSTPMYHPSMHDTYNVGANNTTGNNNNNNISSAPQHPSQSYPSQQAMTNQMYSHQQQHSSQPTHHHHLQPRPSFELDLYPPFVSPYTNSAASKGISRHSIVSSSGSVSGNLNVTNNDSSNNVENVTVASSTVGTVVNTNTEFVTTKTASDSTESSDEGGVGKNKVPAWRKSSSSSSNAPSSSPSSSTGSHSPTNESKTDDKMDECSSHNTITNGSDDMIDQDQLGDAEGDELDELPLVNGTEGYQNLLEGSTDNSSSIKKEE